MRAVDEVDTLDVKILHHAAKQYYVARQNKESKKVRLQKFTECTDHISRDLRLKKSMIKNHVTYCDIFDQYIARDPELDWVTIEQFEKALVVE